MAIYTPEQGIRPSQVVQSRGRDIAAQQDGFNALARGTAAIAANASYVADQQADVYASKAISDAKAQWTQATIERQESAEGEAAGFAGSLGKDFRDYADKAIASAPPRARQKMRLAFDNYEAQLKSNATVFEATKRVAYRSDMLGATLDQNRNTVLSDPSQFEDLLADNLDAIDAMNLPEEKAMALEKAARESLGKSAMTALIEQDPSGAYEALNGGEWDKYLDPEDKGRFLSVAKAKADEEFVAAASADITGQMGGEFFGTAADMLREFEGFRSGTYYDVDHERVGYGSDTITLADGTVKKVQKGDVVSRADAERDLSRRIAEETKQARDTVGGAWDVLPESAKAALVSVAYNYGQLPKSVVAAIRTGDTLAIADAVDDLAGHNSGINAKRRRKEAAIIRGADPSAILNQALGQIDDPVLRGKIAREVSAQYALDENARERQRAALEFDRKKRVAELEVGIDRGEMTYGDIEASFAAGDITPDQWSVLTRRKDSAVVAAEKATEKLEAAVARLEQGGMNPFSTDDQATVDLLFDNSAKTPDAGLALTAATGVAPKEYLAMIQQGLHTGEPEAYETASQLQDAAPNVYAKNKDIEGKVTEYRAFSSLGYSPEEAIRRANRTEAEKKAFDVLDPQIAQELKKVSLSDAGGNGWVTDVAAAAEPSYMADFHTLYSEARRDGLNGDEAMAVANEQIKRTWGESAVSGDNEIVRFPPEWFYPADMEGHEYIQEQAKADAAALSETGVSGVSLRADYVTESDVRAGKPPRYRLFYTDEQGFLQAAPGHFQPVPDSAATTAKRKSQFESDHARRLRINKEILEQPMP